VTASTALKPLSEFETRTSTNTAQRSVTTEYVLESGTNAKGERTEKVAQVHTGHYGGSKTFFTRASRANKSYERGFEVTTFQPFGGTSVRLGTVPAARFSAKGLKAAHESALAELAAAYEAGSLTALFSPESEA
jgi:hypothetical protein